MRELLARIAGWCVARPAPVLAATALLGLVGAIAALRLEVDAGADQLVDRDSGAWAATEDLERRFGEEPVVVLVKADLEELVLTPELGKLLSLEGCLSGNAPGGEVFPGEPAPEPCRELAETKPVRAVLGGATFLNQAAIQAERLLQGQGAAVQEQARAAFRTAARRAERQGLPEAEQRAAGEAAAAQVLTAFEQQILSLGLKYGLTGIPRLEDPRYVSSVVFDSRSPGQPKGRFSLFYPSSDAAQILVRLEPDLTESERSDAIEQIRAAVADPAFAIRGAEYVVSGVPVVLDGLAEAVTSAIAVLLVAAIAVMALALALVVAPPLRLLPLAIALASAAITFGILAALGGSLTMASLAVLPILIGLSVDYAIQFQARFTEARRGGASPGRAAVEAAARGGPVIATAALATGAGFLVLLLSPIPMIRGFALLLVLGVAVAFALALTAGLALLALPSRAAAASRDRPWDAAAARVGAARARAGTRLRALGKRVLGACVAAPGAVLAVAFAIALVGWVSSTRAEVISDIRELVPSDLPELENVDELQEATGVSGNLTVAVDAPDLTDPELVAWMAGFKARVLERGGFSSAEPVLCADQDAEVCPFFSISDVLGDSGGDLSRERIRSVFELLPAYFSSAFLSLDAPAAAGDGPVPGQTVIGFGIKVMPFDEQKELIDAIRAEIDPPGTENDPPAGVRAEVAGLPVLAADANGALEDNRYLLTLAGLAAVALALLAVYRSPRRALVPLVPIVFATGWSALGLALADLLFGVKLNPMSATLGALVIAIATEFSVLLAARYEEERRSAAGVGEALRRAYSRTGTAVVASGITAIAGFAALIATDIRMLRDFGFVTVIDLGIALVGVLVVLPAALAWAERRDPARKPLSRTVSEAAG